MDHQNQTERVIEWLDSNGAILMDIYLPLAHHENSLLSNYDDVFRDEIKKNFRDLFCSMIVIEFSRGTGLSADTFYSVVDDKIIDNIIYKLEDYDLSDYYK